MILVVLELRESVGVNLRLGGTCMPAREGDDTAVASDHHAGSNCAQEHDHGVLANGRTDNAVRRQEVCQEEGFPPGELA